MASSARRAPALIPMNGMAGAGLGAGVFGLAVAVFLGFAFLGFAIMAVGAGAIAVAFSARGRAIAHMYGTESRIARVGLIAGGLAIVLGLLGVILR